MRVRNSSIYAQATLFIALLLALSSLSALSAETPKADETITITLTSYVTESSTETLTTLITTTTRETTTENTTETSTSLYETTVTIEAELTTTSWSLTTVSTSETSTTTNTVTTWPKHGPDQAIGPTVLINQVDPNIWVGRAACCPTTFAMILKWMEKKLDMPLPSPPRPKTDAGLVNLIEQQFEYVGTGTTVGNVVPGLGSFVKDIASSGRFTFAITYQPWSKLKDYKEAIDAGSPIVLNIDWYDPGPPPGWNGGHCVWAIGLGGPTPQHAPTRSDLPIPTNDGYVPITIADPWGGRIVHGWLNNDGWLSYYNPAMDPRKMAQGKVHTLWKVTPKLKLQEWFGVDPVEGYTVVAGDGNYYIISATSFGDVRVTNGEVSGITNGILLRASGPVYGLVNGTVFVPPGVTVSEVNPTNFPSLSLTIINGTELIADPPDMKYYPSMTATLISPEADASLTADTVKLTAKVTVNGTGEASSPVTGATVRFFVNDREIGSATTDSAGVATIEYRPVSSGEYSWYVRVSSPSYPEESSWPPRQFSVTSRTLNVPYLPLPYWGLIVIVVVAVASFAIMSLQKRSSASTMVNRSRSIRNIATAAASGNAISHRIE